MGPLVLCLHLPSHTLCRGVKGIAPFLLLGHAIPLVIAKRQLTAHTNPPLPLVARERIVPALRHGPDALLELVPLFFLAQAARVKLLGTFERHGFRKPMTA